MGQGQGQGHGQGQKGSGQGQGQVKVKVKSRSRSSSRSRSKVIVKVISHSVKGVKGQVKVSQGHGHVSRLIIRKQFRVKSGQP